jgi:signal transduction histidine kinase
LTREERLVAAEHDLRREIERRLHDGPQQQLVALAVELQLADRLVDADAAELRSRLAELREHVHEALEGVRALAADIYPSLLLAGGVVEALRPLARVHASGLGRYADDVESAVYFCCVQISAAATPPVELDLRDTGVALVFDLRAPGLQPVQAALDRVEALGGTVTFSAGSAQGVIPLRPRPGRGRGSPP